MLGYDNCKFILRSSSRSQILKHFQDTHAVPVESGRSVNIQHANFHGVTDPCTTTNFFWSPVLLCCESNGPLVLIHGKIDIHHSLAGWAGICVWESKSSCSENYQIEFTLTNDGKANKKDPVMWTIPLVSLKEAEESLWDSYPAMISVAFIRSYFDNEAEVSANVSIKSKSFQHSLNGNSVWVFSTPLEKEKAQESGYQEDKKAALQPPTIFQNVTCNGCNKSPLVEKRYQCLQCEDFDLCEDCMEQQIHSHHVFAFRNKSEPGQDRLVKKIATYAGKLSILT
ncbi:E3 ubiquitin-protein ligase HERC2 [Orchesella cincta]|uniref:E3 ubiquitin-protein ligase HERC2 n=1 Tax=Orchesella cincta TaxID=48709 RepID=A0A1D2MGD9_ORCCI|nr:E3 ubiquitin-protein ligase HERC2 [Orchesella cincta]